MATTNHVPGQPGDLACSEPCLDGEQNDDPVSVEVPGYVSADMAYIERVTEVQFKSFDG